MELEFLHALQGLHTPWLDRLMVGITTLGDSGLIWIVLCLILLFFRRTRQTGVAVAIALILGALCTNVILKNWVARTRPFELAEGIRLLVERPHDFSFPSGHTTASFAAAAAFWFRRERGRLPVLILACLISFSRLYLFVHYPTDVLAGVGIGMAAGWCGVRLAARFWRPGRAKP